jgi:hypothetical protein
MSASFGVPLSDPVNDRRDADVDAPKGLAADRGKGRPAGVSRWRALTPGQFRALIAAPRDPQGRSQLEKKIVSLS